MSVHPEIAAELAASAALGDPSIAVLSPAEGRALRASRQRASSAPIHERRDIDAGGVPARLYRPNDDPNLPLLVHFHGGGWVIGDLETSDHLCRLLAMRAGIVVLSVDYRLAPEHPFPVPVDDALAATGWALANAGVLGIDPGRYAVSGESAGGTLAAVVAGRRPPGLRLQVLMYPVTDLRCDAPSHTTYATGYGLTAAGMQWFAAHYLSDAPGGVHHPDASPIRASLDDLAGLAPAIVMIAEYDVLRDDGEAYAERLQAAGVRTERWLMDGMVHSALSYADRAPVADALVTQLADRIRAELHLGG